MSEATAGPGARATRPFAKAVLALASLLITLLLLEVGTRAVKWEWRGENFLVGELTWFWAAFPTQYDPELGWAPRPGPSALDGSWGTRVTVLEGGVRSNGPGALPAAAAGAIVAVGDSFTWGAEVGDAETWPALLERGVGRPVVNGGVFGYGVDQSYLRAVQLMERLDPELLIFSFILDDVLRCEQSVRAGTSKPHFSSAPDSGLELHPPGPEPEGNRIGRLRRLSGYSFFLYKLLRRTAPRLYLAGGLDSTVAAGTGPQIACRLLRQLAGLADERGTGLLLVLQGGGPLDPADGAGYYDRMDCLKTVSAPLLDLRSELAAMASAEPERYARFFTRHMTPEGNRWVASRIAEALPVH